MKLGLITDIHEHVDHLQTALSRFQVEGVDQVIVIGDIFETGKRMDETCRLLQEANVIGVWGNHDFGLCVNPTAAMRSRYSDHVIAFMTSLCPSLVMDDCYFSHVEPWLDPEVLLDLWYFEGPPDKPENLDRIFNAVPHRLMFAGHYHQWLLATPGEIQPWTGDSPINLSGERSFIVIGAISEGRFALFDTKSSELIPFNVQTN